MLVLQSLSEVMGRVGQIESQLAGLSAGILPGNGGSFPVLLSEALGGTSNASGGAAHAGSGELPQSPFSSSQFPDSNPGSQTGTVLPPVIVTPELLKKAAVRPAFAGGKESVLSLVRDAAQRYGIDSNLLVALAKAESNFNPAAVSARGAIGVMQLMPGTAAALGVQNPFDAAQNVDGGARYFRQLLARFKDPTLALAAYNAGPNAVQKYGGIPPFRETQAYVQRVLTYWRQAAASQASTEESQLPEDPLKLSAIQSKSASAKRADASGKEGSAEARLEAKLDPNASQSDEQKAVEGKPLGERNPERLNAPPAMNSDSKAGKDTTVSVRGSERIPEPPLTVSPATSGSTGPLEHRPLLKSTFDSQIVGGFTEPEKQLNQALHLESKTIPILRASVVPDPPATSVVTAVQNSEPANVSSWMHQSDLRRENDDSSHTPSGGQPPVVDVQFSLKELQASVPACLPGMADNELGRAFSGVAVRTAQVLQRSGEASFTAELRVPDLSDARILLTVTGKGNLVSVVLHADAASVREVLQAGLPLLRHAMDTHGLSLTDFAVTTQQGGQNAYRDFREPFSSSGERQPLKPAAPAARITSPLEIRASLIEPYALNAFA